MTITFTPQESEEHFHSALCNALDYMSGYGLDLEFDREQYKTAKAKLNNPCYEDILMQILRDGGELIMVDIEGDGTYNSTINIQDVHERVKNMPLNHMFDMIQEQGDATTADVLLQTVFYSDIVFG
jgi:hypothetical protein